MEHWQLHQTLSILKLETDLAAGDLLPREELESTVGSDGVAAAAKVAGNGETKSSGGKSPPVLHQVGGGGGKSVFFCVRSAQVSMLSVECSVGEYATLLSCCVQISEKVNGTAVGAPELLPAVR